MPDVYNESEYDCMEKCDPAVSKRFRATDLPVCRTSCNLAGPESYYLTNDGEFVCIASCAAVISNTRVNSGTTFNNRIFTQITDAAGIHNLVTNAPALDLATEHKKCVASCPYAFEEISGVSVCVDECSPNKYLSKQADGTWKCHTTCNSGVTFYFVNHRGDRECLDHSTDAIGCKFTNASNQPAHKLPEDDTNVTQLVYHIHDGAMRECKKTCADGYYQAGNLFCMSNCQATDRFRERVSVQGVNGVAGANNYKICSVDKCASDLYFRIDPLNQDNECMAACEAPASNTYSLTRSLLRVNNSHTMKECVQSCENNEVFVPDFAFAISGYDFTQYEPLVCKSSCPNTAIPANNFKPHLIIRQTLKDEHATLSDFYSVDRRVCTPNCLSAFTGYETIIENSSGQLTCGSVCPPVTSALDFYGSTEETYHYYDALDARALANHYVCKAICQDGYYQKETDANSKTRIKCKNECDILTSFRYRHERPLNEVNTSVTDTTVIKSCEESCPSTGKKYFFHTTANSKDEYVCSTACEASATGLANNLYYDDSDPARTLSFTSQLYCTPSCVSGLFTSATHLCTDSCAKNASSDNTVNKWIGDHTWENVAAEALKIYRDLDGTTCVVTCSSSAFAYRQLDSSSVFVDNFCSATCPPTANPEPVSAAHQQHYRLTHTLANTQKLCVRECPTEIPFYRFDGAAPYSCLRSCAFTENASVKNDIVSFKQTEVTFGGITQSACVTDCELATSAQGTVASGKTKFKKVTIKDSTNTDFRHYACQSTCNTEASPMAAAENSTDATDGFWYSNSNHCINECDFYVDLIGSEQECVSVCPSSAGQNRPYVKFLRTDALGRQTYKCSDTCNQEFLIVNIHGHDQCIPDCLNSVILAQHKFLTGLNQVDPVANPTYGNHLI